MSKVQVASLAELMATKPEQLAEIQRKALTEFAAESR